MKVIANISILFTCFTVLCLLNEKRKIYFVLALIFFPMVIKVFGKDALTISTILIYLFSTYYLLRYGRNIKVDIFAPLIIILIILGAVSTAQVPDDLFGKAVRKYSDFVSSLLFFGYIYYQYTNFNNDNKLIDFISNFFSVYLIMVATQVVISFLILKVPFMKTCFSYFSFGNIEEISVFKEEHFTISRMQSLIYGYESYAESLAVICPIALYQFFNTRKMFWFLLYALLFIGLVYTGTRSGILLFAFGTVVYILFNFKKLNFKTTMIILGGGTVGFILSVFFFSHIYTDALIRLSESYKLYESGKTLEAMNRPGLFDNFIYVVNNMGFWGNGLISVHQYTEGTHFHSLYQTVMFQFGFIGSFFYFFLILLMLFKLIKIFLISYNTEYKMLAFSMLLSYILFLINEIKFEFNRAEGYQQISWALFASYMLISRYINETIKSSDSAVLISRQT